MVREMGKWEDGMFRARFKRAASDGYLLMVGLAYRSKKSNQITLIDPQDVDLHHRRSLEVESLCSAVAKSQYEIVRFLLNKGVDVQGRYHPQEQVCNTHFYLHRWFGRTTSWKPFWDFDSHWATPLYASSAWSEGTGIIRLLLENGAEVNSQVTDRRLTALHGAIHSCHQERGQSQILAKVRYLLEYAANPMLKDENGESSFLSAANRGYTDVIALMLDHGCSIEGDQGEPYTPLMLTSLGHYSAATWMLLERGAEVNATSKVDGSGPLSLAIIGVHGTGHKVQENLEATVRLLLEFGADPRGSRGCPPLILAVERKQVALLGMLLEAGAGIEERDVSNRTPLEICLSHALCFRSVALFAYLLKQGADPNNRTSSGTTPLYEVCAAGELNEMRQPVLRMLLQHGADTTKRNHDGTKAIDILNKKDVDDATALMSRLETAS